MSNLTDFFGSGGGALPKSQEFTSSGTFVVPTGVESVNVLLVGGGGGGSGGDNDQRGGAGGSAGERAYLQVPVTPGDSVTVTIGAGGAGGANNTNGTSGGVTSFGSVKVKGGPAGLKGGGIPTLQEERGPYSGNVSGEVVTTAVAGPGDDAYGFSGGTGSGLGGFGGGGGGAGPRGDGGNGADGAGNGSAAAANSGAGGGGGGKASGSGGAGGSGYVAVFWTE